MFSTDDTIVAIATPAGRGGLGVVRISGEQAESIALGLSGRRRLEPRRATFARIRAGEGIADQVILTYFAPPRSYTGEPVVEISAHGSPVLLRAIVRAAIAAGARLAEPGEFTLRAYLQGRIDLVQAEAVHDLVQAVTPRQARAAFDQLEGTLTGRIREIDAALLDVTTRLEASLDFPEEGYHFLEPDECAGILQHLVESADRLLTGAAKGRLIREGLTVVLVGRPNTGKSSLFNQLAGAGRAIVTDRPGTTRDLLTERVDMEGMQVTLVDTAGHHDAAVDAVEVEGMTRAAAARDAASVVVVVLDGAAPLTDDDETVLRATSGMNRVVARNKSDLPQLRVAPMEGPAVSVSARTGAGMDALRSAIAEAAGAGTHGDEAGITNIRHIELVTRARDHLKRAVAAAAAGTPEEFVLADVHEARRRLEEVTGRRSADELLRHIFDTFCIGK